MKYIHTDLRQTENGVQMRVPLAEEIRRNDEAVTRLVRSLPRKGWATEEVEPGLYYVIVDCDVSEANLLDAFHILRGKEGHQWLVISANELRQEVLGYYPFPLLIRDPESLYRFYNGEFIINVVVDITRLNKIIAHKGIAIEPEPDGWWKLNRLHPDDKWGERHILARTVGLLGGEFASLRWFADNIITGPMNTEMDKFIVEQGSAT